MRRPHGRQVARRWGVFVAGEVRQGLRRVRGSAIPLLQAAIAGSVAWLVAEHLMGRPTPLFAPIAAFVCLGFKVDRVPRKVAEMGVGAGVGVLIGEVFAETLHVGWWQMGLALLVGAFVGRLLDRGELTTIQAGVNALVVLGMSAYLGAGGDTAGRWIDAVVGATVAFVFAVLLPRHPTERPRRYARAALAELATLLDMLGRGLSSGDVDLLADARGQRRVVADVHDAWEQTLTAARQVVAANPSLWRQRDEVGELERLFRLTGRAQRTGYMLSRQGLAMVEEIGPLPQVGQLASEVAVAARSLSAAVGEWRPPEAARARLLKVAGKAGPDSVSHADWRPVALMSVLRALVVDLLQLTGMSREDARAALAGSIGRPYADSESEIAPEESDDDASGMWG